MDDDEDDNRSDDGFKYDIEDNKNRRESLMGEDYEHLVQRSPQPLPAPEPWASGYFVPVQINGHHFNARIATGSQATVISVTSAEKSGILKLLDKRFAGVAQGGRDSRVPITGRVHIAKLHVGNLYYPSSLTVVDVEGGLLMLGLDFLRRHRAAIDFKNFVLAFDDGHGGRTEVRMHNVLPTVSKPSFQGDLLLRDSDTQSDNIPNTFDRTGNMHRVSEHNARITTKMESHYPYPSNFAGVISNNQKVGPRDVAVSRSPHVGLAVEESTGSLKSGKKLVVRSSEGAARTPLVAAAVEESTASLGSTQELAVRAIDGATQTTAGSLSQLQYNLALGTGISTLGTTSAYYAASGYGAVRSANAAKRSAAANERIAAVQEETLAWQKKMALRKQGKNTSRDNTDESGSEGGGDVLESPPMRGLSPSKAVLQRRRPVLGTTTPSSVPQQFEVQSGVDVESFEFPLVPNTFLIPDFPAAPAKPPIGPSSGSHDDEDGDQDPQQQRQGKSRKEISMAPRAKITNMQRFEEERRKESLLSGKLQQQRYENERKYQGTNVSSSRIKSGAVASDHQGTVNHTKDKIMPEPIDLEPPPRGSSGEDLDDLPFPTAEGIHSSESPAWMMKFEDLPLQQVSGSLLDPEHVKLGNSSEQEELPVPETSNEGSKYKKSSDKRTRRLELTETSDSTKGMKAPDFDGKDEPCV